MSGRKGRRRTGRVLLALALAASLAAALALALAWGQRRALAERWLLAQLAARGVAPAALRVEDVGLSGIAVRDIALGSAPDLRAEAVDASWTLADLRTGRFATLRVERVGLAGRLDEEGVSLGALDAWLAGDGEPGAPLALPAREMTLSEATAQLVTPAGEVALRAEAELREAPEGTLSGSLRLAASHARGDARLEAGVSGRPEALRASLALEAELAPDPAWQVTPLAAEGELQLAPGRLSLTLQVAQISFSVAHEALRVEGRTPRVQLTVETGEDGALGWRAEGSGGRAALPDLALSLDQVMLSAGTSIGEEPAAATLTARLVDQQDPARFVPLDLEARAGGALDALEFHLALEGAGGAARLVGQGQANATTGEARAELTLSPLVFAPGSLQPRALLPVLGRELRAVRGTVEARARATLGADAPPRFELDAALVDVGFEHALLTLEGLHGRLRLRGPEPLETPETELVAMALLDVGLPLQAGEIAWRLAPDGTLQVDDAHWSWAGGTLRTAGAWHLDEPPFHVVLEVGDLSLDSLLRDVDVDGLSGTGRIGGRLPLVVRDGSVHVEGARLAAGPEGGVLRYVPPAGTALAAAAESQLGMALGALSDLRYERLELLLDGEARGEMRMGVRARGANPNFQDGRPVELNVNLEARLADLIRAGMVSYRVPETIEERLRDFSERGRP